MKDNNGNEYEIDHIDYLQIDKENEEKILKSKKYLRALFLIGDDKHEDVIQTEGCNAEPYMMIQLMVSMREILQSLMKNYPTEWHIAKNTDVTTLVAHQTVEEEQKDEEEDKK